ncbi:alpha/beta hydrolase family protein [Brevibacillus sp. SIMBA_040]|uniref:alpha/beta hydrolase family protein n=2 Tax=Bacteria TaxID=2 RepID=UPI00397DA2BC
MKKVNLLLPLLVVLFLLTSCTTNSDFETIEQSTIKGKDGVEIEVNKIRYNSDDTNVVGFILKPTRMQTEKLPVLIFNRGGNQEYRKLDENSIKYLAYLASHQYIVVASQYRGADGGEGQDEYGGKDVSDILNLSKLANHLSYADPSRKVLLGYSRGGMMSYLAIKEGIDVKAAAVIGAPSDLMKFSSERKEIKSLLDELIGDPETKKIEYEERSAVYWPEKLHVPLLILHGDNDLDVNVEHSKKLDERLNEFGMPHKLIVYPFGSHSLGNYYEEAHLEIFSWFDTHLEVQDVKK